jgi:hypothetical protein
LENLLISDGVDGKKSSPPLEAAGLSKKVKEGLYD